MMHTYVKYCLIKLFNFQQCYFFIIPYKINKINVKYKIIFNKIFFGQTLNEFIEHKIFNIRFEIHKMIKQ